MGTVFLAGEGEGVTGLGGLQVRGCCVWSEILAWRLDLRAPLHLVTAHTWKLWPSRPLLAPLLTAPNVLDRNAVTVSVWASVSPTCEGQAAGSLEGASGARPPCSPPGGQGLPGAAAGQSQGLRMARGSCRKDQTPGQGRHSRSQILVPSLPWALAGWGAPRADRGPPQDTGPLRAGQREHVASAAPRNPDLG